jgi:nicotinate-nucleotide pyrophosphorylase (carboxylating)
MRPDQISDKQIQDFITAALYEDVQNGDHTAQACISPDSRSKAVLKVKDFGVLAGVELAQAIFKQVDPTSTINLNNKDGDDVLFGQIAFEVECNTRALLKAERLVLNTMQRMSGIATLSSRFAFEIGDLPCKVLDTRKTTPLIRFLEKWAVKIGGCENYRWGLYDWIMLKDNHVDACGGIQPALEKVAEYQKKNGLNLGVTLEVRNLSEVEQALSVGGFTRIMFDNFDLPILMEAVAHVGKRFETEASGGVTLNTVRRYAQSGVDYVSAGMLTHTAQPLDLSLKVIK